MPKRPNSAAIGMFVIGSLALGIGALAVLGSGSLLKKSHRFICFFQGSLNGLNVGAPVKIRGVQVGSVAEIQLRLDPSQGQLKAGSGSFNGLPVIIDIDESQLTARGGNAKALKPDELNALIARGLRAQLATESLLTGLLYIEVDLHPRTPVNLMLQPGTSQYLEIPTIPTDLQQVQETAMRAIGKLDKLDIVRLTQSITDAGTAATKAGTAAADLMNSPDLKRALSSLQTATINLDTTLVSIREMVQQMGHNAVPVLASLKKTSDQANLTFAQINSTAAELRATLAPDAPLAYRLDVALDNFAQASSALQELTDYLQRNPSAIVRGKYVTDSHQ
jgi:paraquat-inducible protein B